MSLWRPPERLPFLPGTDLSWRSPSKRQPKGHTRTNLARSVIESSTKPTGTQSRASGEDLKDRNWLPTIRKSQNISSQRQRCLQYAYHFASSSLSTYVTYRPWSRCPSKVPRHRSPNIPSIATPMISDEVSARPTARQPSPNSPPTNPGTYTWTSRGTR